MSRRTSPSVCQSPLTRLLSQHHAPVAFAASSLRDNGFGGYYDDEDTFISTTEGITALCEGLKGSAVTSLECAAAQTIYFCVKDQLARLPSHHPHSVLRFYSLGFNDIGAEGVTKLAEVLSQTKITILK